MADGKSTLSSTERRGSPVVHSDADGVLAAQRLEPHGIAARVVARAGDQRDRAVVHGEYRSGGVDVIGLREEGRTAVLAHGEDADHLAAGDEPHRVEVMD